MSIIMGIDPGSRFTGYGLLEVSQNQLNALQSGVVAIPKKLEWPQKLEFLQAELDQIFRQFRPDWAVVENIFLGKNADSAFKLGHVRGVCLATAAQHQSKVVEYAARKVKKVVTGSGGADKEQVRQVILTLVKMSSEVSDLMDATDALALAYCHSVELETQALLAKQQQGLQL